MGPYGSLASNLPGGFSVLTKDMLGAARNRSLTGECCPLAPLYHSESQTVVVAKMACGKLEDTPFGKEVLQQAS